jgi:leader peptidase (prepilin peptidase)/N-methyltransferase
VTAAVAVVCGLVGIYVGLYLNLVIDRVPQKKPMRPVRAGCRNCLDAEGAPSRVPRLPWLARRGRCPTCGERVSARYPLVEVGTAALYAAVAVRLGADAALPAFLVLLASLMAISVIDLELQIIPNRIIYPTLSLSLPLLAAAAIIKGDLTLMETALAGAAIAFAILLVVHLVSPASMGFGDVRLAFILGLFLGWFDLSHVAIGLFLGFALGAVVGIGLMLFGGKTRKDSVSFGPFLAAGAVVAVLAGDPLLHWWLRT